jgi:hypothetical protein
LSGGRLGAPRGLDERARASALPSGSAQSQIVAAW